MQRVICHNIVKADTGLLVLGPVRDDRPVRTGVFGDLADRLLKRALHDLEADFFPVGKFGQIGLLKGKLSTDERDFAAGNDAFVQRGAGREKRPTSPRFWQAFRGL